VVVDHIDVMTKEEIYSKAKAYSRKFDLELKNENHFFQIFNNIIKQYEISSITEDEIFKIILSMFNASFFTPIDTVEIIITEYCNLQCDYCFVKRKSKRKFSIETAKSALNFLMLYSGSNKDLYFTILGGEPLLEFNTILQILDYAEIITEHQNKKIYFDATINGTLLTEEILKKGKSRINYLLSIDGGEFTHNKHRTYKNGRGSFKEVLSKVGLLKKYQPWIGARITVCPDTVHLLSENIIYLYNIGINQFIIGLCYGPNWGKNECMTYNEELQKTYIFYKKLRKKSMPIKISDFEDMDSSSNCLRNVWGCRAGRNAITITADGKIFPCSMFVGLSSFSCDEFLLGNLHSGITNLSTRERLFNMKSNSFKECNSCKELDRCTGGCIAENFNKNKSIYSPNKDHCKLIIEKNKFLKSTLK